MKRILLVTAYPINNKTAGQNYTLQLLNDLSNDNIIDLFYWEYPGHKTILNNKNINIIGKYNTNSNLKILYYSIIKLVFPLFIVRYNLRVQNWIKQNYDKYDIIYFDFSQTFIYSKYVNHPCKVMMCHDIIAQKYERKKFSFFYNWLVRKTEKELLANGNHIFSFSKKDKALLEKLYNIKSEVVSFYISKDIININFDNITIDDYFVFYGAWNRKENTDGLEWFLHNVYPKCSNIKIKIIGGALDSKIKDFISKYINIEYLGFVNNPYIVIAKSQALLAPIFSGAGVKVKVIETMALGTPIIGTNIAFEGIDNIKLDNRNILIEANNKNEFINSIKNYTSVNKIYKNNARNKFLSLYDRNKFNEILKKL